MLEEIYVNGVKVSDEEVVKVHERVGIETGKSVNVEPKKEEVKKEDVAPIDGDDTKILGKFKTEDDLQKSYKDLEAYKTKLEADNARIKAELEALKTGKAPDDAKPKPDEKKPVEGEEKPEDGNKPDEQKPDEKKAGDEELDNFTKQWKEAGFSVDDLNNEVISNNFTLTDETMSKITKLGYSKRQVELHLAGLKYERQQAETALFNELAPVIGDTKINELIDWVNNESDYSDEDKKAFDSIVSAGNKKLIKALFKDLNDEYVKAKGVPSVEHKKAKVINGASGGSGGNSSLDGEQMMQVAMQRMQDKRYNTDMKFREETLKMVKDSYKKVK